MSQVDRVIINPQEAGFSSPGRSESLDVQEGLLGRSDDFGGRLADHYFMMPRYPESEQARLKESLHERATAVRETLEGYVADEVNYPRIARVVEDYPIPEQLRDKIYTHSPVKNDLITALTTCDDTTLAEFCVWNRDYQEELLEQKAPLIETYRQQWVERIEYAIEHQNLPVSMERLETRMQQIRITLGDALTLHGKDRAGYYAADVHEIAVGSSFQDNDLKAILWHELMHHLSGQTIAQVTTTLDFDDDLLEAMPAFMNEPHVNYESRRVGLDTNSTWESRGWLNEAVTEQLTQILLSDTAQDVDFQTIPVAALFDVASGVYKAERDRAREFLDGQTLEEMEAKTDEEIDTFAGKIPTSILLAAYFEDHVPEKAKGTKAEARRAFWAAVTKAYPENYREELSAESIQPNIPLPPAVFKDLFSGDFFDKLD